MEAEEREYREALEKEQGELCAKYMKLSQHCKN